jgi:predicted enzyme related to lactoylglutathione lyase
MTGPRISHVMIDARDPEALARFWTALLDTDVEYRFDEGRFVFLAGGEHGPAIGIQRVPESKVTKNRVHVDLEVDDVEAWTRSVRQHGGSRVADHQTAGIHWRIMADPEGNEFCLVPRPHST